jgi:hypothetical protein
MGSCSLGDRHIQEQTDLGDLKGLKVWIWPVIIRDKELSGSKQVNSWGPPSGSLCVGENGPASRSVIWWVEMRYNTATTAVFEHTEQRTTPQRCTYNPCRTDWYWSAGRVARSVQCVAPSPAAILISLRRQRGSNSIPFIQILRTCFLSAIPAKQH